MEEMKISFSDITFGKNKIPTQTRNLKVFKEDCSGTKDEDVMPKNEVSVVGTLLSYKGVNVSIIKNVLGEDWWKAVPVTKPLGYVNSDQTIRHVVSKINKKSYDELLKLTPLECRGVKLEKDLTTIYINTAGVFELLSKSRKKEAKEFQKWVNCEVLPSINKTGYYNIYDGVDDVTFNKNDNLHVDYVVNNSAYDICDVNTIYLGYIGTVTQISNKSNTSFQEGEICYKFGITTKGVTRAEQHKNIIDGYTMFYVKKCVDHIKLENALKFELKQKGLLRNCVFGKYNYTELFTVTSIFTIDDVIKFIDDWIDKHDYKYKNDSILLAEYTLKNNEEITKQKSLDVEKLKLEIELLKLQTENNNK